MPAARLFARGSAREVARIAAVLRLETVGGGLLLAATAAALLWANLAPEGYESVRQLHLGIPAVGLDLSIEHWAADGLLAIFFFVAGLELKREFVAGDLRNPRAAALPVAAAVGGMAVPALFYTAVILLAPGAPEGALRGWAIPTATDIAFALGVLAVVGRHLPGALRTFLLTLAVVDDLLAIVVIAVFYTADLAPLPMLLALVPLAAFTVLVQRRIRHWYLLLPLALLTWGLVHASGIHATVAGVLLGLVVPVVRRREGPGPGLAEHFEHLWRPVSTGFAVPVFALMSAGVTIGGASGFAAALRDPVALAIMVGLVLGKPVGIVLTTVLLARLTRAELDPSLHWIDVVGMAILAGIGFTVSLLIGSLAFGEASEAQEHVTLAVLLGSTVAAVLAAVVLATRSRRYRLAAEDDEGSTEDASQTEEHDDRRDADETVPRFSRHGLHIEGDRTLAEGDHFLDMAAAEQASRSMRVLVHEHHRPVEDITTDRTRVEEALEALQTEPRISGTTATVYSGDAESVLVFERYR